VRHLADEVNESHEQVSLLVRDPQQRGQLTHDDVHGDACQKARGDRHRQQRCEPTGPQQPDRDQQDADQQREERRQLRMAVAAGQSDRRQSAGEDRRDGRVGPDRHEAVGTQDRVGHRAHRERIDTGLRRHTRQSRGGELPGNRDRCQHQPGDEIARQPFDPIPAKRCEDPALHGEDASEDEAAQYKHCTLQSASGAAPGPNRGQLGSGHVTHLDTVAIAAS